jgi:hypothetical protein
MTSYSVYIRSDIEWTMHTFEADTPEEAIELARRFVDDCRHDELIFDSYAGCDCPINEIEVCDEDDNELAVWYDEDKRLRLAARALLEALEALVDRDDAESIFATPVLKQARSAIAKAKEGAA